MADLIINKQIPEGEHIVVEHEGKEIGVYNHEGEYYAHLNWCSHMSGPTCEGAVSGKKEASFDRATLEVEEKWCDERVINCPWHGWQFDLETGECLSRDEEKHDLLSYTVVEEVETLRVKM